MSLIAVEAAITFADRESRDRAIEQTAAIQQATRDDEPGCVVYCFAADPCNDTLIQVYELWESEETLAAHFHHQNYFDMRETLGGCCLTGAVSRKHRIDASAPVYNADHTATVAFD